MPSPRWFALGLVLIAATAAATGLYFARHDDPPLRPGQLMQAGSGLAWYRGNLHTHTLWSDGDAYPETVVDWYARHGYQFLVLSDHNAEQDGERWIDPAAAADGALALQRFTQGFPAAVQARDVDGHHQIRLSTFDELSRSPASGKMLLLRGDEVSDFAGPLSVHLGAINLTEPSPPTGGADVNAVVRRNIAAANAVAARHRDDVLLQLNHPNYLYAITAEQLMRLRGTPLFEVYNGHPLSNNEGDALHPSTERLWDIALAWRIGVLGLPLLYGTATDDAHDYLHVPGGNAEPGRGWVVVLADAATPRRLLASLRKGRFYASTGVSMRRIVATPARMEVEVDAQPGVDYRIEFIGTRDGFDTASTPTRSATGRVFYGSRTYDDRIGEVLQRSDGPRAVYWFDPDDLYVRARITASRRHPNPSQPLQFEQAWIQPILGPAARSRPRTHEPAPALASEALAADEVTRGFQSMPQAELAALRQAKPARCALDQVTDTRGNPATALPRNGEALFGGWIADPQAQRVPGSLAVLLAGRQAYVAESGAGRVRPDVARALANPALEGAGFMSGFQLAQVHPDRYRIWLVGFDARQPSLCDTGKFLTVQ